MIENVEDIWIERKDLIVGVIYKPPSYSNRDFLDKLEETLQQIHLSKRESLIMGT